MNGTEKTRSPLRIVVLGYIVRGPLGGLVWHHLQYVLGLHQLGHEVLFLEDSDDYPSCYIPGQAGFSTDPTYGLHFLRQTFSRVGLADRWAFYDAHTDGWFGKSAEDVRAFCREAQLVLNLSGMTPLRDWTGTIPVRVFVDTDPAFTQIRHLEDAAARRLAGRHTTFFSFGELFHCDGCTIPDDGFPWQPTRQPVVLDQWPATTGDRRAPWTTVMQWDSYRVREHAGRTFGMKSTSFEAYRDLPRHSGERFELAIGSATAPTLELQDQGWMTINPLPVTRTPWSYQSFIEQSKGEWSVAKHGYVTCRSGWFSERSAAYLASGRPVVVQDTGFSRLFPSDRGLLAFSSPEEALAAIEAVDRDYVRHCRAAREVAAAFFDAAAVLPALLDRAGSAGRALTNLPV